MSFTIHLPYLDDAEYAEKVGERIVPLRDECKALSAMMALKQEDRNDDNDNNNNNECDDDDNDDEGSIGWLLHEAVYPPKKTSCVELRNNNNNNNSSSSLEMRIVVGVDRSGRIKNVVLGGNLLKPTWSRVHFPEIVRFLEHLESLTIFSCILGDNTPHNENENDETPSFELPRLKKLELHHCGFDTESKTFPLEAWKFPNLEKLVLKCADGLSATQEFYAWIRDRLPGLDSLEIVRAAVHDADNNNNNTPAVLVRPCTSFPRNLRHLNLRGCKIDEDQLEILLFRVLPECPGIEVVDLSQNNISSLEGVRNKIERLDGNWRGFRSRLQTLWLVDNPIEGILTDPKSPSYSDEMEAAKRFLRAFSTIRRGIVRDYKNNNNPLVFEMLLNATGRYLMEDKYVGGGQLSVWPLMLSDTDQWALKQTVGSGRPTLGNIELESFLRSVGAASASARFHLLRHGPIFTAPQGYQNGKASA